MEVHLGFVTAHPLTDDIVLTEWIEGWEKASRRISRGLGKFMAISNIQTRAR